jgi:hypothetical protein
MAQFKTLVALVTTLGIAVPMSAQTLLSNSGPGEAAIRKPFVLQVDQRTRWEQREGVSFGNATQQQDMLSRFRIGFEFRSSPWFRFVANGQDSRVAFYGKTVPASMQDNFDLYEAYLETDGGKSYIPYASTGRRMLDYGDSRLIGSGQWSNVTHNADFARIGMHTPQINLQALVLSPVKVVSDGFDTWQFGEHLWGTYDIVASHKGFGEDFYYLRHGQNQSGGWTKAGSLLTNSFGARVYGTLPAGILMTSEAVAQFGHYGALNQRAYAWVGAASRLVYLGRYPTMVLVEEKAASGSHLGSDHSASFDILWPANHDKFGHQDLFGWRNLKTTKVMATASLTKAVNVNLMYSDEHLFSASDSLYNSSGSAISTSKLGTAGTHVGQEIDTFATYRTKHHLFGAGVAFFVNGEFAEKTTPNINPRYYYLFQQFTLK